jgi:hypothetical protein
LSAFSREEHAPLRYFAELHDAFLRAAAMAGGTVERDLLVGGVPVRLRFAGEALVPHLFPALAHLAGRSRRLPRATICAWDSRSTGVPVPRFPWLPRHLVQQGEIKGYNDDLVRTIFHGDLNVPGHGFNALSMSDLDSRTAMFWVAEPDRIPWSEQAEPLRPALHWLLASPVRHLVHAAAIGTEHGGALIAGKGGSGKTTTALACLDAGFVFVGDNYILVSTDNAGPPLAHSLFSTVKLRHESLALVADILPGAERPGLRDAAKVVRDIRRERPDQIASHIPIRAILLPRVVPGKAPPRLRPASGAGSLLALAPSTIYQLPRNGGAGMGPMADLAKRVPAYTLELGSDLEAIPPVIAELLEKHALGEVA